VGVAPRRWVHVLQLLAGMCLLVCATGRVEANHPTLIQTKTEVCATCHEEPLQTFYGLLVVKR